mgnify:CR=1 FL=1
MLGLNLGDSHGVSECGRDPGDHLTQVKGLHAVTALFPGKRVEVRSFFRAGSEVVHRKLMRATAFQLLF